jgi:hypothetical protein
MAGPLPFDPDGCATKSRNDNSKRGEQLDHQPRVYGRTVLTQSKRNEGLVMRRTNGDGSGHPLYDGAGRLLPD